MINACLRRILAEFLGTALLLATVVGSGIMATQLSGGNAALALLCNALATGAILFVLLTILGPISGAHLNPVVSMVLALERRFEWPALAPYVAAQIAGAVLGVWVAHAMFDQPLLQVSASGRSGLGQWLGETVATFGLVLTVLGCVARAPQSTPIAVGLYLLTALWFTSSTFVNPAGTVARALTDTFVGIAPADVPALVVAQLGGAMLGTVAGRILWPEATPSSVATPAACLRPPAGS